MKRLIACLMALALFMGLTPVMAEDAVSSATIDVAELPAAGEHPNAADCIRCGHCDSRCPFSVRQSERMQEIRAFMETR